MIATVDPLRAIVDLARWAPSGDNTQPWRFRIEGTNQLTVFGHDTRRHCVYDLDGHASQISIGALLETISLASTRFGLEAQIVRRADSDDEQPIFDVTFHNVARKNEDALVRYILTRRVQRRPLQLRRLVTSQRQALERSVEPGFRICWFEGLSRRWTMAWLNFTSAKLRLTIPEAYQVHRAVIEWDAQVSEDRIPDAALGASRPTLALMHWALASWNRIAFLNRYLGGTVAARIELDLVPGLACAAHCVFVANNVPRTLEDRIATGRALQRFWLTATGLGLQFQPQYTPLVFARYARESVHFSSSPHAAGAADAIRVAFDGLLGPTVAPRAVFMGRIGAGESPSARSGRLPLERLLQRADDGGWCGREDAMAGAPHTAERT